MRPTIAARTPRVAADPHSFGNPDQIRVHQLLLDLTVDFDHRILKGIAVLDIVRQPGCPADAPLVLDSRGLTIEEVGCVDWKPRLTLSRRRRFTSTRLTRSLVPG